MPAIPNAMPAGIVYTRQIMFPTEPPEPTVLSITPAPEEVTILSSRAERFLDALTTVTPAVYVTYLLLAVNILVFLAMTIAGVGLSPTNQGLIRWGADFGPRTTNGEWWRLVTSMFVHIGFLHIAFNMFALLQVGPLMERILGNLAYTVVYFICGLGGAIASVTMHPYAISAGASGAIFGLYGALVGFMTVRPKDVPEEVLSGLLKGALSVIGYNVIYGLMSSTTDMSAHVGGLLCGYACGLALSLPISLEGAARRTRRLAVVFLSAAFLLSAATLRVPRTQDLEGSFKKMGDVEKKALAAYQQALFAFASRKSTAGDFAVVLEKEILPPWNAERQSLSALVRLPARQQQVVDLLIKYMDARAGAWSLLDAGLRENRRDQIQLGIGKQAEAVRLTRELSELTGGQKLPGTSITVRP
jgi:rhomboid protease GluP